MSMLPPTRRGGTIECRPGSAGASPIVPQNGFNGTCRLARRLTGHRKPVVGPDMQRRVLELIGKQTEAWNVRGPTPAGCGKLEQR